MSTQHKALFVQEKLGSFAVGTIQTPKPAAGEILVRNEATALNPVDWKIQKYGWFVETYPAIIGSDAAGVVTEVGEGVTNFAVGDKVVYQGYFTNQTASFQQYAVVPADIAAKIPSNLTFDQAATLPVALAIAAVGLYYTKKPDGGAGLVAPWKGGEGKYADQPILILGGASSAGQYAIQLAKLSGFSHIITTASLKNAEHLKSLGATHIIDRNQPDLAAGVKKITEKPLNVVYDAISSADTQNAAYDVLAPGGLLLITLDSQIDESKLVGDKQVAHPVASFHIPQYHDFGVDLYSNLTRLLESGAIKPNNLEVVGGLADIPKGLEKLEAGQVSGIKLVAHPQE